jgi:hypothetical protein
MKTLISNNGGYKLFVEVGDPIKHTDGDVQIRFLTQYEDAKNPDELHVKFAAVLTKEQRQTLKDIL